MIDPASFSVGIVVGLLLGVGGLYLSYRVRLWWWTQRNRRELPTQHGGRFIPPR